MDCDYTFNRDEKKIIFTINSKIIETPYNEDVDLTDFIKKLTTLIDKKTRLNDISSVDISMLDEKEKIINQSIQTIIQSFNETINEEIIKKGEQRAGN